MMKKILALLLVLGIIAIAGFSYKPSGATNFDRIVLGTGNYGEDPNTTADITGQNDEYISNYTNGTWDFGAASLTTTGSFSSIANITMTGDLLGVDSLKARTLYLSGAIANVTNVTATGDFLGIDSLKARTMYLTGDLANVADISGDSLTLSGTITVGNTMAGIGTFDQYADEVEQFIDTVSVPGMAATDIVVASCIATATTDTTTFLTVKPETDQLVVFRNDTAVTGQTYNWIRLVK